jgi:protein subunit release factor A
MSRVAEHYHTDTPRFQAGHDRVRTYNLATNRVVDHGSGMEITADELEHGGFDRLITSRKIARE